MGAGGLSNAFPELVDGAGKGAVFDLRRVPLEETGLEPSGPYIELGSIRQKAGKVVHAWAIEGDADPSNVEDNAAALRRRRSDVRCSQRDARG